MATNNASTPSFHPMAAIMSHKFPVGLTIAGVLLLVLMVVTIYSILTGKWISQPPAQRRRRRRRRHKHLTKEQIEARFLEIEQALISRRVCACPNSNCPTGAAIVGPRPEHAYHKTSSLAGSDTTQITTDSECMDLEGAYLQDQAFEDDRDEDQLQCAVCFEALAIGDMVSWSTNCRHAYHHECIKSWLLTHEDCPYCRQTYMAQNEAASQTNIEPTKQAGRSAFYCIQHGAVLLDGIKVKDPLRSCGLDAPSLAELQALRPTESTSEVAGQQDVELVQTIEEIADAAQ